MRLTDAFLGEHAVFYAQFDACERTLEEADQDALRQQAAVIASALHSHAQLEDELLFDDLQTRAGESSVFAVMEQEHREIAGLLDRIEREPDLETTRDLLRDVIHAARAHFTKEERVAFPMAEQLLDDADLSRRGDRWAAARHVALGDTLPAG